jgi:hypothetical protein
MVDHAIVSKFNTNNQFDTQLFQDSYLLSSVHSFSVTLWDSWNTKTTDVTLEIDIMTIC